MKDSKPIEEQDINIQIYRSDIDLLKNYIDTEQPTEKAEQTDDILNSVNHFSIVTVVDDVAPNTSEDYADEITGTIDEDETYASQLTEQSESANEQSYYEDEAKGKHF